MKGKMRKYVSVAVFGVLMAICLMSGFTAQAASGPKFIYTFDDMVSGSNAFESGYFEKILPESGMGIDFTATVNADTGRTTLESGREGSGKVATDWGKSIEVSIGEWKIGAPQWEYMWLNIPAESQDWSSYKHFGFYWNNQRCLADSQAGLIFLFEDGDGETWGWKSNVNVQDCWTFTLFDGSGNMTLEKASSSWQGFGHENWYGSYITILLDDTKFERKANNEKNNGNGVFDLNKIKRVQIQINAVGATGFSREGDIMYLDDFFLAKQVRTSGDKYIADGVAINQRNQDKINSGEVPVEKPVTSTPSSEATNTSSDATSSDTQSDTNISSEAISSDAASSDDKSDVESDAVSSELNKQDNGNSGSNSIVLIIVIIAVVVLAAAGVCVYLFVIKKKA